MRRRGTAIFFLILGISLSVLAITLNIGWILLNLREVALLVFGVIFFSLIITGLILNTIFLVREIRRNEQHDAFINAVTHELKTPIASIKLYLETLKTRELDRKQQLEFYDIMLADNERLLSTVEQVLEASRTREKNRTLNTARVDIGDLIRESIGLILSRKHLEESAIRFTPPSPSVCVMGDRAELQTAILNLLDNAVKYSGGEPRISVRVRASRKDETEIYIRDHGIGMARSELKRIFKRFYRVQSKAAMAAKGTGLGLAIVRAVIEKHGGRIRAQSKGPGKGTTFLIQLPTAR
jgi:signal transduction histidine kinase